MKTLLIIGCRKCPYAKFTEFDLKCKFLRIPCGLYKSKSLKLFKNHPEWCPLNDDVRGEYEAILRDRKGFGG